MAPSTHIPTTPHDLKPHIHTLLDKLSDRATLPRASAHLHHLARTLPLPSLPAFLSCLLSVDAAAKPSVRAHSLSLISTFAHSRASDSLSTHLAKFLIPSLLRRLRDNDSSVRAAAETAAASLAGHLGAGSFWVLLDALLGALMTEQDYNVQVGSAVCLAAAIEAAPAECAAEVAPELKRVLPKVLKLVRSESFKAKPALLRFVGAVVAVNGGAVVNGRGLMSGVVGCAVEFLRSEDWAARKAAAEVLEKVAVAVEERELVAEVKSMCVSALESRRFDKVKVARETMNRALEAWKGVAGGPDEDSSLSQSSSSFSKDNGIGSVSPPIFKTPKLKKTLYKTRSLLSDGSISTISPPLSKTRSSLSDDSTITDSSSVSKSSHDFVFETPQSKKTMSKNMSSLSADSAPAIAKEKSPSRTNNQKSNAPVFQKPGSKGSTDWKIEIAVAQTPFLKVGSDSEDGTRYKDLEIKSAESEKSAFFRKNRDESMHTFGISGTGLHMVPFDEGDDVDVSGADSGVIEEIGENNADFEDFSLIRKQLVQIEKQQSNLLELIQRFMGNSQNGITSLETRVTGLERALDEISYDLALHSGRILKNDSTGNSCCPGAEFLSPKFWKKTEKISSINVEENLESVDVQRHRFHQENEGVCKESPKKNTQFMSIRTKGVSQNGQKGRPCSAGSFDGASPTSCMTPPVRGA